MNGGGVRAADVERILAQCAYRGFTFRVARMASGGMGVALDAEVECAYRPGVRLAPSRCCAIDGDDVSAVLHAAFGAVLRFEQHEAAEHFRFRGVRPFDPHTADV